MELFGSDDEYEVAEESSASGTLFSIAPGNADEDANKTALQRRAGQNEQRTRLMIEEVDSEDSDGDIPEEIPTITRGQQWHSVDRHASSNQKGTFTPILWVLFRVIVYQSFRMSRVGVMWGSVGLPCNSHGAFGRGVRSGCVRCVWDFVAWTFCT